MRAQSNYGWYIVSLRTYPLIAHPAFLSFIESSEAQMRLFDRLAPADVPVHYPRIDRPYDIARYIGVNPLMIRGLVRKPEKHYRSFDLRKRSGGTRTISAPRTFLKVVQWWILDTILENKSDFPFVYGFSKGKSFVDNARFHHGASHVLNVDVKNFFPSILHYQVAAVFQRLGYDAKVSAFLADLCTFEGGLPQGAPTSPKISNFVFESCDIELHNLAQAHGMRYSRYADDLTFSSEHRILNSLVSDISAIIGKMGFSLNEQKTRFMGKNQVKEVTGLVLGRDGIAMPRRYLNGTRGWFHRICQVPDYHSGQLPRVLGTMNLIQQVGGRGSEQLLQMGRMAVIALQANSPARLEWGKE